MIKYLGIDPPKCWNKLIYWFLGRPDIICSTASWTSIDIFEPVRTLIRWLNCTDQIGWRRYDYFRREHYYNLLYNFTFENRSVVLTTQPRERNSLVAEWFEEGDNFVNISVCRLNPSRRECNPNSIPLAVNLENVAVFVRHNTTKFFPYGNLTQDSIFPGGILNEGVVALTPPDEIPFFQGNYRILYVCMNACMVEARSKSLQ